MGGRQEKVMRFWRRRLGLGGGGWGGGTKFWVTLGGGQGDEFCAPSLPPPQTWRQLWRVLEMSDVLLLIADARHPVRGGAGGQQPPKKGRHPATTPPSPCAPPP